MRPNNNIIITIVILIISISISGCHNNRSVGTQATWWPTRTASGHGYSKSAIYMYFTRLPCDVALNNGIITNLLTGGETVVKSVSIWRSFAQE